MISCFATNYREQPPQSPEAFFLILSRFRLVAIPPYLGKGES